MISHKLGIVLLHVPRTGGWSISEALKEHDPDIEYPGGYHGTFADHEEAVHGSPADYSWHMVIRNPWDRLASCNHYVNGGAVVVPWWNFFDHAGLSPWFQISARYWWDEGISKIWRYEELGLMVGALEAEIGLPLEIPHHHKTERRLPYREYFPESEDVERVREACDWEIKIGGYEF